MARKLTLLVGLGTGYVLGARAGRERYEQIRTTARRVWRDPRVQQAAHQAAEQTQHAAQEKAAQVGDAVKEKVTSATHRGGGDAAPGGGGLP